MLSNFVKGVVARYNAGAGMVGGLFNVFKGRSTFFAMFFTGVGTYLAIRGKLDMNYVGLATAIQGFVVGHSWKEDAYAPTRQDTTVVVNAGNSN